jgi:hypothetical protein
MGLHEDPPAVGLLVFQLTWPGHSGVSSDRSRPRLWVDALPAGVRRVRKVALQRLHRSSDKLQYVRQWLRQIFVRHEL